MAVPVSFYARSSSLTPTYPLFGIPSHLPFPLGFRRPCCPSFPFFPRSHSGRECINIVGGFKCSCGTGFIPASSSPSSSSSSSSAQVNEIEPCIDRNECLEVRYDIGCVRIYGDKRDYSIEKKTQYSRLMGSWPSTQIMSLSVSLLWPLLVLIVEATTGLVSDGLVVSGFAG